MFPLAFSPGPANIVFAMSGMRQGIKNSIPLIIGVDLVFIVYSLIIGFGLGEILKHYSNVITVLQLLGALHILYLAYKFIQPAKEDEPATTKILHIYRWHSPPVTQSKRLDYAIFNVFSIT